jgi:nitrogen-specific signal transduction histidine kinase
VQIAVLTEADTVTVELSDDGPGIASRVRDTLFDPFVTTRRADGATGLGLTLARAVLHAHDGALEAADSPAGARFRLLLPQATPC